MACMEHVCTNLSCDWRKMDNEDGPKVCPKCGSPVIHHFDEADDAARERYGRRRGTRTEP